MPFCDVSQLFVRLDESLRRVIECIDDGSRGIALVVTEDDRIDRYAD